MTEIEPTPKPRVRQDQVHWHRHKRGWVWWLDEGATRHEAPRTKVKVWAYISTYGLWHDLQAALMNSGPRTLAEALQKWRRDDLGAALAHLDQAKIDLQAIATAVPTLNRTSNHSFAYTTVNPQPDKGGWVARGYDTLNTETALKTLAGQLTLTAGTFGGDDKYAHLIEVRLEPEALLPDLDLIAADIDALSYALRTTKHHDIASQSRIVKRHLPARYRKKCANRAFTHWFAALRSDARYCSDACRQAAYRNRANL